MAIRVALPFIDDRAKAHVGVWCRSCAASSTVHDVANLNSPVPDEMPRRFAIEGDWSTARRGADLVSGVGGLDSDLLDILRSASEVYEASDEVRRMLEVRAA